MSRLLKDTGKVLPLSGLNRVLVIELVDVDYQVTEIPSGDFLIVCSDQSDLGDNNALASTIAFKPIFGDCILLDKVELEGL
jgi:hypothetical protein